MSRSRLFWSSPDFAWHEGSCIAKGDCPHPWLRTSFACSHPPNRNESHGNPCLPQFSCGSHVLHSLENVFVGRWVPNIPQGGLLFDEFLSLFLVYAHWLQHETFRLAFQSESILKAQPRSGLHVCSNAPVLKLSLQWVADMMR